MDMKAQIVQAGGELFRQKGYDAVTVNEICQACHITKPTFYYHIKSKQDILLHLYDVIIDNLTPMLLKMIHTSSSWNQIRLLFDQLIDNISTLGADLNSQLLIVNLQRKERALRLRKPLEEIACDIIATGQKNGQFRNKNKAASLYEAAAYMFTGYEYMWCTLQGEFDWRGQFFHSLEALLDVDPALRK
jgi:AcrR family transcriptional regulator